MARVFRRSVFIVACIAVALTGFGNASSPACAGDNNDAKRMQEQAREMQRQAEESRREAEQAARRMEAEARQQQRESAQRERDAARQAREDERAAKSNSQPSKPDATGKPASAKTETAKTTETSKSSGDKKNDRKSDKKDENKDDKKKDSDETDNADAEIDAGPPATVEQWLKRLAKPSKAVHETPVTNPVKGGTEKAVTAKETEPPKKVSKQDLQNPAIAPKTSSVTAPVARKANPPNQPRRPEPIEFPDFRPELLAVNATPHVIDRAKSLGFKTSSSASLTNLRISITRLVVPAGMSSTDAQALLKREMPKSNFAPNQKYRIYRTAGTSASQPAGVRAAKPNSYAGKMCDDDRCFGRDAIGWSPALAGCASGVRIGVIDTSVDLTHPAFSKKKPSIAHLGRGGAPGPDWHGTGVTALLAGDASGGTPGLIPDATFFVADIFYADDDNEPASDTVSMLRAFDWLESNNVKIVNMSLSGPPDDLIRKAIEKLSAKGVIFVAAAGNEGPTAGSSYPAAYDQVIAVTAVTKDLQNYRYANRGSYIDFAAPGVAIYTALPGAMEGYHSGTSFATPYVTATLAALYPQLATKTYSEAMRHFKYKDLGTPGPDPIFGHGLVMAPKSCTGNEMAGAPASAAETPTLVRTALPPKNADTSDLPWLGFRPSGD